MKRNRKIIKLSPGCLECSDGVFVMYRKNILSPNPDEIDQIKDLSLMQTAYMRAVRN